MADRNDRIRAARERAGLSRPEVADAVAAQVYERTGHVVGIDAHYIAKLERGVMRWPNTAYRAALREVLHAHTDAALGLHLPAHPLPDSPDPEVSERVALAAACPRRTDNTTVTAIAVTLASTRRLEDSVGVAAVWPSVQAQLILADSLLTGALGPARERLAGVAGEMHQYAGWLLLASGNESGAHHQLDTALALGVEIDHPDLVSMSLSFKGTVCLENGDAGSTIALSRAAVRDERIFIAQQAYNAFQEARGHGMAKDARGVERAAAKGEELAERSVQEQHNAPPGQYWYGEGFFDVQRGLAWHELRDPRHAARAALALDTGFAALPEAEQNSEWAAMFTLHAAEAHADSGDLERGADAALRTLRVARSAGSRPLEASVRRVHADWATLHPTAAAVRSLADALNA